MTDMMAMMNTQEQIARSRRNRTFVRCAAIAALLLLVPQVNAQQASPALPSTTAEDIEKFCTNIADTARDQRYLLQKQELEKLQSDVDQRIVLLEKRKAEYEDWLKRRDDFMAKGGSDRDLQDDEGGCRRAPAAGNAAGTGGRHHHEIAGAPVGSDPQRDGPEDGRHDLHDHVQRCRPQDFEGPFMIKRAPALLAVFVLAGCQSQTVKEIGNAPSMSPIGSGLQYAQTPQMGLYPKQPRQMTNGYSLWSDSQAALFKDARALNVGDILTVDIQINDKADFDNETDRSRTNSTGLKWDVGASILGWKPSTNGDLSTDSDTSSKGKGSTKRSEKLNLLVAAVVTGVLENGNLLISGSQEVRVNHEIRILNVAGIVRPQDVNAKNTISYDRIAEARISYGGRGRLMEVQQPPVGQQVVDLFSPF